MVSDLLAVSGIAIGLSVITILINKLLINEKLVNDSRERMKKLQKELKEVDPKSKEYHEKQDELLNINMTIMKQQFKPMFITFLPYIIVFYIIGASFAYAPIGVGSQIHFDISGNGHLAIPCAGINETFSKSQSMDATINSSDCKVFINGNEVNTSILGASKVVNIAKDNLTVKITPHKLVFIKLPFSLPWMGSEIGWLGTYILISLVTSSILNKALKNVYLRKWE